MNLIGKRRKRRSHRRRYCHFLLLSSPGDEALMRDMTLLSSWKRDRVFFFIYFVEKKFGDIEIFSVSLFIL